MKIAIVGSGIAGLSAARLLHPVHDITVFEKEQRVGGHAHTVFLDHLSPTLAVDSGFIVFNPRNYPEFTGLLAHLHVATMPTDMSFAVSMRPHTFEFSSRSLGAVFADPWNLCRPSYWRFLAHIVRFNRVARTALQQASCADLTVGDFVARHHIPPVLLNHYLLPLAGAIWSAPLQQILAFPAHFFLRFLDNHGLLQIAHHPQWHTIQGGSQAYVTPLIAPFRSRIQHHPVVEVTRTETDVRVTWRLDDGSQETGHFDHVVLATHADDTLKMMSNPTPQETAFLQAFPYQENQVYLHQDPSFMPQRQRAWASWNTLIEASGPTVAPLCVTYWMNLLQGLPRAHPLFVTLNPHRRPEKTLRHFVYSHPTFQIDSLKAQSTLRTIQGKDRIWYCGAYLGYGFHEDGLKSGLSVALQLGAAREWQAHPPSAS